MKEHATQNSRTGECFLCHERFAKTHITRHLKKCIESLKSADGKPIRLFHLAIEGRYFPDYWMHVGIPGAWTLYDLDYFLRNTWLECCDHMSCFTIDGCRYAYEPYNESFSGRREKSMDVKIYQVLNIGAKFAHEYDYGSTTDLVCKPPVNTPSAVRADVRFS